MYRYTTTKKAFARYHAYNPKYFPLVFLKIVFERISPYFNLWMSAEIVTALYEGRERNTLYFLVAVTLFGNFFVQAAGAVLRRISETAREVLDNNEAAAFYRKTLSLDYNKMENPQIHLLRRKIQENSFINSYGVVFMRNLLEMLFSSAIDIVFSAVLFVEMISFLAAVPFRWFGVFLILLMAGFVVANTILQAKNGGKSAVYWDQISAVMLEENRISQGYMMAGMDNRIYRQQLIVNRVYEKSNKAHLQVFSKVRTKVFSLSLPNMVLFKLSELCSYLVICFYCVIGAFPVGSLIKYVGYLGKITGGVSTISYALNSLKTNEQFLETYLEYFAVANDMYQGSLAVEKRSDKQFEVDFCNVGFRYAGMQDAALKNINLKLKVGERLAVVGQNGSGKTTFIKLLCRLYDPTEGEIFMNDFNIRKYDYRQYLDLFSVVFQDYNLLALPLGNNVASAPEWDKEKAKRLLCEVGFGERYETMPAGLDTPLYKEFDEEGVNVSGGEAQKIALARALYKDAPFIILDEPTAALDPIAEAEIYAKFDEIVGDKTAIYISHRLSSCRFCDKIAVFDGGRIVQVGTHEELLRDTKGKYYELWQAQAQYYA